MKESIIYFVSKFSIEEKQFFFDKDLLQVEQWEHIFSESIYNEEICIFREDGEEYMLVIKKPCLEIRNEAKNYVAQFHPVSGKNEETVEPDDITYSEIVRWLFDSHEGWEARAQEFIQSYQLKDELANLAVQNPKKRFFTVNKYEDVRSYRQESDRIKEFPCKMHCFYAKFSKYDIRRVKSL